MTRRASVLALMMLLGTVAPGFAVRPGEQLPDPEQEARARRISAELRCLVCQNQSIDDSDAALATDLRRLVRERVSAGDSDRAVLDFLVVRYGEFILLKPVFSTQTLVLWGLPLVALLLGGTAAIRLFRRKDVDESLPDAEPGGESALSEAERRDIEALLAERSRR
jgi:cytochrome c-type biogenesis protein CcmH